MAWRLLAVLLVLTGTVWSAPIVIKCYDGSASAIVRWSRGKARLGICDLDHALDGRCQFRVSLGAPGRPPGVFEMTLDASHRKRIRYVGTAALLKCRPGPEPPPPPPPPVKPPPGALTYTCRDAVPVESSTDPVCDVDQACDDTCTFGFHCPTCCGCLSPCFSF